MQMVHISAGDMVRFVSLQRGHSTVAGDGAGVYAGACEAHAHD